MMLHATVNFNCGFGDVMCVIQEGTTGGLADFITGSLQWVFQNTGMNTSSEAWDAVMGETSFWWGISTLGIMVAALLGIGSVLIKRDKETLIRVIWGLLLVFPAVTVATWLVGQLLNFTDALTPFILGRLTEGSMQDFLSNVIFGTKASDMLSAVNMVSGSARINTIIVMIGFAIGLGVMTFVSAIRTYGLMVLVAFMPLVFMLIPLQIGTVWVKRWATMTFALIATQPLMEGMFVLVMKTGAAISSPLSLQMLPILVGMVMMLFTPFAAFSMFSFLGAEMAPYAQQLGGQLSRGTQSLGRSSSMLKNNLGGSGGAARGGSGVAGVGGAAGGVAAGAAVAGAATGALKGGLSSGASSINNLSSSGGTAPAGATTPKTGSSGNVPGLGSGDSSGGKISGLGDGNKA